MRHFSLLARVVAGLALLATPGSAGGPKLPSSATPGRVSAFPMGRSLGSPTAGQLVGGCRLPDGAHLRVVPAYGRGDVRWGLGALVGLLDRAGRAVRHQFPDAVLSVGHLSRQHGGEVDRHVSHESGRDADVAFYVRDQGKKALYAGQFVSFCGDGSAKTWPGAHFDDARNWALVAALLSDSHVRVSHIFVAAPLRARLLAYAERVGAPASIRSRAAEVMMQPRGSLPHDDHFHVRISCPGGMTGCVEEPTVRHSRRAIARAHPKGGHTKATHAKRATIHGGRPLSGTGAPAPGAIRAAAHPATGSPSGPKSPESPRSPSTPASESAPQPVPSPASAPSGSSVPGAQTELDVTPTHEEPLSAPPAFLSEPLDDADGPLP